MTESVPDEQVEFLQPEEQGSSPLEVVNSPFSSIKEAFQLVDKKTLVQLLLFLAVSLVIAAGVYVYLRIGQEGFVGTQTEPANSQTAASNKLNEQTKTVFSNDQKRKNDVATLNSALKSFFLSKGFTPESLDELVSESLPELPTDPETKQNYTYAAASDLKTWTVSVSLSDGTVFKVSGP